MKARLIRGIGANLYAQVVTSLIQVAAVPVLLAMWGPARYGVWTLLSALPAALAFTDGGLVLATGTAMTAAVARHDTALAAGLFRQACRTVGGAAVAVAVAAGLAAACAPANLWRTGADGDARVLTLVFALVTLLGVGSTLPGTAFRADGRYAFGVALGATLRAAETAAVLAAATLADGLTAPAVAWLLSRAAGMVLQFGVAGRLVPWLRRPGRAETPRLAPLLRPALAAVAIPGAFAISLQGVTVAAGLALPPEAVAGFAAARTLARVIVQAAGLVTHALMPEMTRIASRADRAGTAALLRLNRWAAAALLIPGWIVLLGFGHRMLAGWTGGRLALPAGTLPLLATAALVHGLWLARANLLLAVNRQEDYAWAFLTVAGLTAAAAALGACAAGLVGVAGATLAGELAMALWVAHVAHVRPAAGSVFAGALPR